MLEKGGSKFNKQELAYVQTQTHTYTHSHTQTHNYQSTHERPAMGHLVSFYLQGSRIHTYTHLLMDIYCLCRADVFFLHAINMNNLMETKWRISKRAIKPMLIRWILADVELHDMTRH